MASIKRRGETFLVTISLGFDGQGKRIRKVLTYDPIAKTPAAARKEAEQFASEQETRLKRGTVVNNNVRFDEFLTEWEDSKRTMKDMTESQIEQYLEHIKVHVSPVIGHLKLKDITRVHCDQIVRNMIKEGKSPATVRRIVTSMMSVFSYAKYLKLIYEDPTDELKLPKIERDTEVHAFNKTQAMAFLSALDGEYPVSYKERKRNGNTVAGYTSTHSVSLQWKVYFYLAVFGGFRRGELLALNWYDVNYIARTITISKAVTTTKAGQITKDPKTKAGFRTVVLPSICFELLAQWEEEQRRLMCSVDWQGMPLRKSKESFIFIQTKGKSMGKGMDVHSPTHKFREILDMYNASIEASASMAATEEEKEGILENKLPIIRLHDLRHTTASLLVEAGTDLLTVSKRLGHSKASTTLDIYSHAYAENDTVASDTLEHVLISQKSEELNASMLS